MPYHPELKVVGWTSSYRSVQKLLKWMKKEKLGDDVNETILDSIHLLCEYLEKNPDEIIAEVKSSRLESLDIVSSYGDLLRTMGADEEELNIRVSQVIVFLSENRAF